jgi:hypothetical protein
VTYSRNTNFFVFLYSSYGKTITNKERHRKVDYCNDDEVSELINSPFYRQMNVIDDDTYEVESAKKKIKLDLPLQVCIA